MIADESHVAQGTDIDNTVSFKNTIASDREIAQEEIPEAAASQT